MNQIFNNTKPVDYNQPMLQNDYDLYDKTLEEYSQHLERLKQAAKSNIQQSKAEVGSNTKRKKIKNIKALARLRQAKSGKALKLDFLGPRIG